MANVREVNADLMLATRPRQEPQQGKFFSVRPGKSTFHEIFRLRRQAVGANTILNRHAACLIPAQRGINHTALLADMPTNDRQIFLLHLAAFPEHAQFPRDAVSFCREHHAAGLAIEAIDQMRTGAVAQVQPHATNKTGHRPIFARMTNQPRRLVDSQPLRIFTNDIQ